MRLRSRGIVTAIEKQQTKTQAELREKIKLKSYNQKGRERKEG